MPNYPTTTNKNRFLALLTLLFHLHVADFLILFLGNKYTKYTDDTTQDCMIQEATSWQVNNLKTINEQLKKAIEWTKKI